MKGKGNEHFSTKKLSFQVIKHAIILPCNNDSQQLGGIIDTSTDSWVDSSAFYEGRSVGRYDYADQKVIVKDETIIYIGNFTDGFGHLITDDLKKLWFLRTKDYKDLQANGAKLAYIANWCDSIPPYVCQIFKLAGVDLSKCIQIQQISKYDTVYVPDNAFIHEKGIRYFTQEFRSTYQIIRNNIKIENRFSPKIYFSRTKLRQNWHRDYGEIDIERVFKKLGYQILYPETLSPEEQICAIMHCTHFAATEGSISHNSVFCNPGTIVTIIRKANVTNSWQSAINEIANLNVTYVNAHNSIRTNKQFPMVGPFYMCITPELCHYVGHYIPHLPLWLRPSWYRYKYQIQDTNAYKKAMCGVTKIKRLLKIQ